MCFKRGREDSVLTVVSRHFPIKTREELGPLLAEEVGSRIDFEKITCDIKACFILIAKLQERELMMKEEREKFLEQEEGT